MQPNKHQILVTAVARLLRPLVRVLLRNGVSYGTFADIAKRQFVDVARDEFSIEGRKQSLSRISVITGLTRKEVARVSSLRQRDDEPSRDRYNRASRVIAGWRRDRDFLDRKGRPMALTVSGKVKSFQELVRRHSGDVPYRAVLDEMQTDGSVERLDENRVRLRERAYLPKADETMKLHILGVDTAYLIDTIDHNMGRTLEPPRFQRKVLYDNLPDGALREFRRLSAEAAQGLLEKLDRWLSSHDRDTNPGAGGSGRNTAGVGIYYFEKPCDEEDQGP
ncbi:MAG TPA: DUF6502 family protein [Syntrophales bacterium]|nr:DUF6502 family protein [Syntrophales bacterium]HOX94049.1 DUF6502 family protein [Syntrophales bacterium]HPI57907.1 DUF6502 family protein [Syntrophales bacterium]HPN24614.1 DUF6502 family protein [Syntrophales bacterium]HQM28920.1 DUF6502 family protein [Syntrophales bacterium]